MTEKLPKITAHLVQENAVRKPECCHSAAFRRFSQTAATVVVSVRDGENHRSNTLATQSNSLKNNNLRLRKFTVALSVYIYFKIYIPATVTSVSNRKS